MKLSNSINLMFAHNALLMYFNYKRPTMCEIVISLKREKKYNIILILIIIIVFADFGIKSNRSHVHLKENDFNDFRPFAACTVIRWYFHTIQILYYIIIWLNISLSYNIILSEKKTRYKLLWSSLFRDFSTRVCCYKFILYYV